MTKAIALPTTAYTPTARSSRTMKAIDWTAKVKAVRCKRSHCYGH